jgi:hypothetical protein
LIVVYCTHANGLLYASVRREFDSPVVFHMHRRAVHLGCVVTRLLRRIGNTIHVLGGGIEWLRIVVIVLLLLLWRRCVVRGLGVGCRCFWLGLGCLSYRAGWLWLGVLSVVPWKSSVWCPAKIAQRNLAYKSAKRSSSAASAIL